MLRCVVCKWEYSVGRKRTGKYIIEWWVGDHSPRHVHVFDSSGEFMGRVILETMRGMQAWSPPRDLVRILRDMLEKGEL